jgi:hypothetical protein
MNIEWVKEHDMCVYLFISLKHEDMAIGINFFFHIFGIGEMVGVRDWNLWIFLSPRDNCHKMTRCCIMHYIYFTMLLPLYFSQTLFHEIWEEKWDLWAIAGYSLTLLLFLSSNFFLLKSHDFSLMMINNFITVGVYLGNRINIDIEIALENGI